MEKETIKKVLTLMKENRLVENLESDKEFWRLDGWLTAELYIASLLAEQLDRDIAGRCKGEGV